MPAGPSQAAPPVAEGSPRPLEHRDVHRYALESGLLSADAVVHRGLVVHDRSSRHRTFVLECADGSGLVVKQGVGTDGAAAVAREAAVYRRLGEIGGAPARYLASLKRYDARQRTLVLGL